MKALHEKAVALSKTYLTSEVDLLTVLMEIDDKKGYIPLGYTGIFNYCLHALKFSESQASYFSSVARKSREVPQLKQAIDSGVLTISKARRIVKVITPQTQALWINKAATLAQIALDKEVAEVNPSSVREQARPIGRDRHELRLSVDEGCFRKLNRARALMKKSGLEEALEGLLDLYLEKKDPIKKAERALSRKVAPSPSPSPLPRRHRLWFAMR